MAIAQTEKTVRFIKEVKRIVESGEARSLKQIAEEINYNNTALSQVLSGSRNVPNDVYARFTEIYTPLVENTVNNGSADYKDKYMALLEKQLHEREAQINARFAAYDLFIEKMNGFVETQKEYQEKVLANFALFEQLTMVSRSYLKMNYQMLQEVLSLLEKKPLTTIQQRKDKQLAELMTGAS